MKIIIIMIMVSNNNNKKRGVHSEAAVVPGGAMVRALADALPRVVVQRDEQLACQRKNTRQNNSTLYNKSSQGYGSMSTRTTNQVKGTRACRQAACLRNIGTESSQGTESAQMTDYNDLRRLRAVCGCHTRNR